MEVKMNPFTADSRPFEKNILNWKTMYPNPYDKAKASPFTKTRIILMNGTEFESTWFLHQFARHCNDNNLRREIALIRNQEQQQQKRIGALKPLNENFLETTISYEQLAIELTAILAQNETDANNLASLNFALLEDFDHLYRFANLLKKDYGIEAAPIVGKLTEIMPGRPTINEHRHPYDNIKFALNNKKAAPYSKLVAGIITAAEQQTMNFYMNMAAQYHNDLGRRLFAEIGMVEEMHVTQYESLRDPTCTWLENWLMHEYTECYLYHSCMLDETDADIRGIWKDHFEMEVAHLKRVAELLNQYEGKSVKDVIPMPDFPPPLKFGSNMKYVRDVIKNTVHMTNDRENYKEARELPKNHTFFMYNDAVNGRPSGVASHQIIDESIKKFGGKDYRFQKTKHPLPDLDDRGKDDVRVGRV
jgi:rubrerythrin